MKKYNNLLVGAKKLALLAMLTASVGAYGQNDVSAPVMPTEHTEQQEHKELTTKNAWQSLIGLGVGICALCFFLPAEIKEYERKDKIIKKYMEKQK